MMNGKAALAPVLQMLYYMFLTICFSSQLTALSDHEALRPVRDSTCGGGDPSGKAVLLNERDVPHRAASMKWVTGDRRKCTPSAGFIA